MFKHKPKAVTRPSLQRLMQTHMIKASETQKTNKQRRKQTNEVIHGNLCEGVHYENVLKRIFYSNKIYTQLSVTDAAPWWPFKGTAALRHFHSDDGTGKQQA